ncbi:MAG: PAS domain-containing protein, partial [Candidatus Latescibacterota bacterium]
MDSDTVVKEKPADLRRRAEESAGPESDEIGTLSTDEMRHLIPELRMHQAELEIQNEELKKSQQELAEAYARITELYDYVPVGYFILDREGVISEVNLAGAGMLGIDRNQLKRRPFSRSLNKESIEPFYRHL